MCMYEYDVVSNPFMYLYSFVFNSIHLVTWSPLLCSIHTYNDIESLLIQVHWKITCGESARGTVTVAVTGEAKAKAKARVGGKQSVLVSHLRTPAKEDRKKGNRKRSALLCYFSSMDCNCAHSPH